MNEIIPIHDFVADNEHSIPFNIIALDTRSGYDTSEPHRHNYYEIFFFTQGGGKHLIDFKHYEIKSRSIHFVSPGQVHLVRRENSSYGYIILFSRDFFHLGDETSNTLYNFPFLNNSQNPVLNLSTDEYKEFETILQQIKNEYLAKNGMQSEILRSYLHIVLLKCFEAYKLYYKDWQRAQQSVFNQFRKLIESTFRAERLPSYYAKQLNITEKKLNDVCKENCGENAGDFIKNRVLLEAKRLLYNTDHNIKEIAYFLGFEDPSYFNRFFRNNVGVTPNEFREKGDI